MLGRRDDGYHEIESWFVPLALADELEVAAEPLAGSGAREVELRLASPARDVPAGDENLAVRAARVFLEAARLSARVRIRLEKRVPAAAGLGGGSSDAGAVLCALARLHPDALTAGALAELALGLGADVPFFLEPAPARVTGIGERIEPLAGGLPLLDLVLVRPPAAYSTAQVYAGWDASADAERGSLTPSGAAPSLDGLSALFGTAGPETDALAGLLGNDLEPAATRLCPVLAELRRALASAGARGVGMSGSGPTMYGVFEDEASARAAREALTSGSVAPESWVAQTRTAPGR